MVRLDLVRRSPSREQTKELQVKICEESCQGSLNTYSMKLIKFKQNTGLWKSEWNKTQAGANQWAQVVLRDPAAWTTSSLETTSNLFNSKLFVRILRFTMNKFSISWTALTNRTTNFKSEKTQREAFTLKVSIKCQLPASKMWWSYFREASTTEQLLVPTWTERVAGHTPSLVLTSRQQLLTTKTTRGQGIPSLISLIWLEVKGPKTHRQKEKGFRRHARSTNLSPRWDESLTHWLRLKARRNWREGTLTTARASWPTCWRSLLVVTLKQSSYARLIQTKWPWKKHSRPLSLQKEQKKLRTGLWSMRNLVKSTTKKCTTTSLRSFK